MEDSKTFELVNKVYVSQKQKTKRRFLLKVAVCLCLLFIVISLVVGKGINASLAPVSLLLAVSLAGLASVKQQGVYKSVPCILHLGAELKIENNSLDREDSLGVRNEVFTIQRNNIESVEYSDELNALRIVGAGEKRIVWISRKGRNDKIQKCRVAYVYLDPYNKNEILDAITGYFKGHIKQVK